MTTCEFAIAGRSRNWHLVHSRGAWVPSTHDDGAQTKGVASKLESFLCTWLARRGSVDLRRAAERAAERDQTCCGIQGVAPGRRDADEMTEVGGVSDVEREGTSSA